MIPIYFTITSKNTVVASTSEELLGTLIQNALNNEFDPDSASLVKAIESNTIVKSLNVEKVMSALGPMAAMAGAILGGVKRIDLMSKLEQRLSISIKGLFGTAEEAEAGKAKVQKILEKPLNDEELKEFVPDISVSTNTVQLT